jgi:hypothetical protein
VLFKVHSLWTRIDRTLDSHILHLCGAGTESLLGIMERIGVASTRNTINVTGLKQFALCFVHVHCISLGHTVSHWLISLSAAVVVIEEAATGALEHELKRLKLTSPHQNCVFQHVSSVAVGAELVNQRGCDMIISRDATHNVNEMTLLQLLRSLLQDPDIPIVLAVDEDDYHQITRDEAIRLGFFDILYFPIYYPHEVNRIMERWLRRARIEAATHELFEQMFNDVEICRPMDKKPAASKSQTQATQLPAGTEYHVGSLLAGSGSSSSSSGNSTGNSSSSSTYHARILLPLRPGASSFCTPSEYTTSPSTASTPSSGNNSGLVNNNNSNSNDNSKGKRTRTAAGFAMDGMDNPEGMCDVFVIR